MDSASPPNDTPQVGSPTPSGAARTRGGQLHWKPLDPSEIAVLLAPQYEVFDLIGHGGMGAVYRGRQTRLDRIVAIKLLPPSTGDDPEYALRFEREAKSMAALSHPAIVPVYDFGETANGWLYFVMEHVDGTDVQKMIRDQGKLPAGHALAVTAHLCDALQYAHDRGVVHRDIKPANVLLNREGRVKVADFGLAKRASDSALTSPDVRVGTPAYMAPEALTLGMTADHRADLYSAGAMLYAMLTGEVPRGIFDLPSVRVPGTDPRFNDIVIRAMKTDAERRYQSAADMRRDLDEILAVPLIEAGGDGRQASQVQEVEPAIHHPPESTHATPDHGNDGPILDRRSAAPRLAIAGGVLLIAGACIFMFGRRIFLAPPAGSNPPVAVNPPAPPRAMDSARLQNVEAPTTSKDDAVAVAPKGTVAKASRLENSGSGGTPATGGKLEAAGSSPSQAPKPKAPEPAPSSQSSIPAKIGSAPGLVTTPGPSGPKPARLPDPSKWVPLFDAPESLANRFDVVWTDQGVQFRSLTAELRVPDVQGFDIAVRAKFPYGVTSGISIRNQSNGFSALFIDVNGRSANSVTISKWTHNADQSAKRVKLGEFGFDPPDGLAQQIELQCVAVGKAVAVSVNGKLAGSVFDDADAVPGMVMLTSEGGLVHDIAWQPLDLLHPADEKLAALERTFRDRLKREVDGPFESAVDKLAVGLKAAVERSLPDFRGSLGEVALRAELERLEKKEPLPAADEPKIPLILATMRKTWHAELDKLRTQRTANAASMVRSQDEALAALEKELSDEGDAKRFEKVKAARAVLASPDFLPPPAGLAGEPLRVVNERPGRSGRLKMIGCLNSTALPLDEAPFAKFGDFVSVKVIPGQGIEALRANGSVIVQRLDATATSLVTYTVHDPPIARLCDPWANAAFGLTEDGRAVRLEADPAKRSGIWSSWKDLVDFSGETTLFAGLKADGTVLVATDGNNLAGSWLPKPGLLPKAKRVAAHNDNLIILTENGGVKAWSQFTDLGRIPDVLLHGIVQWTGANIRQNTFVSAKSASTRSSIYWEGSFLNRAGDLIIFTSAGGTARPIKNVEQFRESTYVTHSDRRVWSSSSYFDRYGEHSKALGVFKKGNPIDWDYYATPLKTSGSYTGIFVWIE